MSRADVLARPGAAGVKLGLATLVAIVLLASACSGGDPSDEAADPTTTTTTTVPAATTTEAPATTTTEAPPTTTEAPNTGADPAVSEYLAATMRAQSFVMRATRPYFGEEPVDQLRQALENAGAELDRVPPPDGFEEVHLLQRKAYDTITTWLDDIEPFPENFQWAIWVASLSGESSVDGVALDPALHDALDVLDQTFWDLADLAVIDALRSVDHPYPSNLADSIERDRRFSDVDAGVRSLLALARVCAPLPETDLAPLFEGLMQRLDEVEAAIEVDEDGGRQMLGRAAKRPTLLSFRCRVLPARSRRRNLQVPAW